MTGAEPSVINSLIHQRLLSTCCVPGTVLGTTDATAKLTVYAGCYYKKQERKRGRVKRYVSFKDGGSCLIGRRLHGHDSLWETEMDNWKVSPPSSKDFWKRYAAFKRLETLYLNLNFW